MTTGRPLGALRLAASSPGAEPARVAGRRRLDLRILATTDVHGQILSYDYFANRPQFGAGLAQTA